MKMKNYCDKCGNCSRCGNCCSAMIPLTRKEEKQIRNYIKENQIAPEFFQNENNINLQCCFYDREKKNAKYIMSGRKYAEVLNATDPYQN